jgi:hypothetical protein
MRYWQLKETNRVIAVDVPMTPRWKEITKEDFEKAREQRQWESLVKVFEEKSSA